MHWINTNLPGCCIIRGIHKCRQIATELKTNEIQARIAPATMYPSCFIANKNIFTYDHTKFYQIPHSILAKKFRPINNP